MAASILRSTTNRPDVDTRCPNRVGRRLRSLVIAVALITGGFLPSASYSESLPDLDGEPEFYLMDIRVDNFMLAESVPAYLQDEQLYLHFGIFLEALEFQISREGRIWSGWFRRDDERFSWSMDSDQPANSRLSMILVRPTDWLESDEGIFVATRALEIWFSLDLPVDTRRQILAVKSDDPLPFQQRMARDSMKRRYRAVNRPDVDVRVPDQYHWFTLPMFDLSTYLRTKSSRGSSSTANTTSLTTGMDLLKHSIIYSGSVNISNQTASDSQNRMTVERKAATFDGAIALGMTQSAPSLAPSPMRAPGPIRHPEPTFAEGPTVAAGPTETPSPISALSSITAEGWIPGLGRAGGRRRATARAKPSRGFSHRMPGHPGSRP